MTKKEMNELAQVIATAVVGALRTTPTSAMEVKKPAPRGTANESKTKEAQTTKYSTALKDYAPKKDADGFYIWGKKTDTVKSQHYLAMQKAYCYAVATKGQALTSDECLKFNLKVDYENCYNKAKDAFKKKYVYVAKKDR